MHKKARRQVPIAKGYLYFDCVCIQFAVYFDNEQILKTLMISLHQSMASDIALSFKSMQSIRRRPNGKINDVL